VFLTPMIAGVKIHEAHKIAELEGSVKIGKKWFHIDELVFPVNSEDIKALNDLQDNI